MGAQVRDDDCRHLQRRDSTSTFDVPGRYRRGVGQEDDRLPVFKSGEGPASRLCTLEQRDKGETGTRRDRSSGPNRPCEKVPVYFSDSHSPKSKRLPSFLAEQKSPMIVSSHEEEARA